MRKVKHLTVNLTPILDQDGGRSGGLSYVPQGTTAGSIQLATTAAAAAAAAATATDPDATGLSTAAVLSVANPQQRRRNRPSRPSHSCGNMDIRGTCVATLSPSSDLHITPQIYISYEICGLQMFDPHTIPSGR